MASTVLQKDYSPGSTMIRYLKGKFEALRYLPKLANGLLRFNAAGELISSSIFTPVYTYTANGAIALKSGVHVIAKTGSLAAMTVAAPSTSQDGERLTVISNTAFAHTITFTGSTLHDGTTGANLTATMTAFRGSSLTFVAVGGVWLLESSSNVTSITA